MRCAIQRRRSRGAVAVEAAALMPLLLVLLLGLWEIGRLVEVKQLVLTAAREAARQAAGGSKTQQEVREAAANYLEFADIDTDGLVVTVRNLTNASNDEPSTAEQLDRLEVVVELPIANVRWLALDSFTHATVIDGRAEWRSMRDLPVVVSHDIPLN